MTIENLTNNLSNQGFEIHGRSRGKSGTCYIVASIRGNWDYGDKECRDFVGVSLKNPDTEWIRFKFSISRSALSTDKVLQRTGNPEDFLLQAGLLRFRRLLFENDSPGRSEEFMIVSTSPERDFVMHDDPSELRVEVKRVQMEVLDLLWQNRHRGIKRTPKQDIENIVCAIRSIIDPVLDSFEKRNYIKGAYGSAGIKITTDGEAELDRLQALTHKHSANVGRPVITTTSIPEYDVFISHASEDKDAFVRNLAQKLKENSVRVWYDEFTLKLGDSLRESIDRGLAGSRYGLVILSHHFFSKDWPQRELNGLFATMKTGDHRILPIWHELSAEEVQKYSPILSDLLAVKSSEGVDVVVQKILEVCKTTA